MPLGGVSLQYQLRSLVLICADAVGFNTTAGSPVFCCKSVPLCAISWLYCVPHVVSYHGCFLCCVERLGRNHLSLSGLAYAFLMVQMVQNSPVPADSEIFVVRVATQLGV